MLIILSSMSDSFAQICRQQLHGGEGYNVNDE